MLRTKHRRRHLNQHHQHANMNEHMPKAANGANGNGLRPPFRLQCVDMVHQIPVVESAFGAVGGFYDKIKNCNAVAAWSFGAAEEKFNSVLYFTLNSPKLQTPLIYADTAVCYSLSFVEDRIPAIKQQPQELLHNVRGAVSERAGAIARPVLVRAASMKEVAARQVSTACDLGLQRADEAMNTRVGAIAAESLDVGLELAEQLLDTYLPPESSDEALPKGEEEQEEKGRRALHTVHRVDRLTRTLQRRLTRRTLAQVKTLRQHAMDAIMVILGLAKTAVSDPKGSADSLANLWRELSEDEPENQPPPETLEQRTSLLAREAARRLVHVVNAAALLPKAASKHFSQLLIEILHSLHLERATHAIVVHTRQRLDQLQSFISQISSLTTQIMEAATKGRSPHQTHTNNHQHPPAVDQVNNHTN